MYKNTCTHFKGFFYICAKHPLLCTKLWQQTEKTKNCIWMLWNSCHCSCNRFIYIGILCRLDEYRNVYSVITNSIWYAMELWRAYLWEKLKLKEFSRCLTRSKDAAASPFWQTTFITLCKCWSFSMGHFRKRSVKRKTMNWMQKPWNNFGQNPRKCLYLIIHITGFSNYF